MLTVEVTAPTNIALVKYWGKHPKYQWLFIPTKSSVSFTLSSFFARTRLTVDAGNGGIDFTLNGQKANKGSSEFEYVESFFERIFSNYQFARKYSYCIESQNNFPTAAGFASSAAGFSALAFAFALAMSKVNIMDSLDDKTVSIVARLGSGSAARSIPSNGGMVIWHRGYDKASKATLVSKASYAETLYPPSHFAELAIICVKVSSEEKKIRSRAGMEESVRSVYDYWQWVEYEESTLLPLLLNAAKRKKWQALFKLTKQASNNFHSVCLRTTPPMIYLSDRSREIIEAIQFLPYAAYTFDAGPNAVVITLKDKTEEVEGLLKNIAGKHSTVVSGIGNGPREVRP
jgi:diphosphomevalonate decarboxylase